MADAPDDGPSLEMPSFSLRRRKKDPAPAPAVEEPTAVTPAVDEPTAVTPAVEESTAVTPAVDEPTAVTPAVAEREPAPAPESASEPEPERRRRELPRVAMAGLPAAALTGLVVGVLAVLLTWLAAAGCDAVRGTSSCGGAVGLPVLLVGLVLLAWLGSVLLRVLGVRDAGSTSVLAVGILAVLVMLFLLGSLDQWWAAVVVPLVSVLAHLVSWWVTTAVTDDDGSAAGATEPHDVR